MTSVDVLVKRRSRTMWATGDWPAIAMRIESAARALVGQCGVGVGDRVLDVAAGNGNVAVCAARAGASVVATDLSEILVQEGRRRCAIQGLDVGWQEADMEELPFADAKFDSVLCAFGITLATRPHVALGEVFRVTRPGGCIGLANWASDGWPARIAGVMQRHLRGVLPNTPSASGEIRGTAGAEMFGPAAAVRTEQRVLWQHFISPEAWWEHWDGNAPQMTIARQVLSHSQYGALRADLIAAAAAASAGDDAFCRLAYEYRLVIAVKRSTTGEAESPPTRPTAAVTENGRP